MDRHILLIDDYTDNDDPPIAIDTSPWQQHSSSRQTSKISIQGKFTLQTAGIFTHLKLWVKIIQIW